MKKIIALLLVILVFSCSACSKKNKNNNVNIDSNTNTDVSITDIDTDTIVPNSTDNANSTQSTTTTTTTTTNTTTTITTPKPVSGSVTHSNKFLSATASKPLSEKGQVKVTISTKDLASVGSLYGLQFSTAFKEMTLVSIDKHPLPSGWTCTAPKVSEANVANGMILLFDCNFSTSLDNRPLVTLTFNSNGTKDSIFSVFDIKGVDENFSEVNAYSIDM